ncbi:MAG: DnaD domain protein [Clostridiaceae bacterium]|nr:DnaD domain protein [Clostridiaceae bacterium]
MRIKDSRSIMFSDTPVPDLFIQDMMPKLSGNAVKCYLFLNSVFHNGSRDATRADVADRLGISEAAVDESLLELQSMQLITVGDLDIAISDLKMHELLKRYRPVSSSLPGDIVERENLHEGRETMVNQINMTFFQGMMTFTWYDHIDRWFEGYGFDAEVMYALFQEAANHNRLDGPGYVIRIAEDWAAAGVKTYDQLSVYYSQFLEKNKLKALVGKRLRRHLSEYDLEDIDRWIDEYGYGKEIIEEALSKTRGASTPSVRFVSAILKDWHEQALKTIDDVRDYENKRQADITRTRGKSPYRRDNRDNFTQEEDLLPDDDAGFDTRMPRIITENDQDEINS